MAARRNEAVAETGNSPMSDADIFKHLLEDLESARNSADQLREASETYDKARKSLLGAEGALDKAGVQLTTFTNKVKPIIEQSATSLHRVLATLETIDPAALKQVSLQVRDELRADIHQEAARLQAALNETLVERLPRQLGPLIHDPIRNLSAAAVGRIEVMEEQQRLLLNLAQRVESAISEQRHDYENRMKLLQQQMNLNSAAMERRLARRTSVMLLTVLLFVGATSFSIIALLQPTLVSDLTAFAGSIVGQIFPH